MTPTVNPAQTPTPDLEARIDQWRVWVKRRGAAIAPDVDELEDHLRAQIADLTAAGLTEDEALLIAVRRLGSLDALTREFAREHSDRLWKQLVLGDEEPERRWQPWAVGLAFATGAAIAVKVPSLFGVSVETDTWYLRNVFLLVLPFLAGWFAWRRRPPVRVIGAVAALFAVVAVVANLYYVFVYTLGLKRRTWQNIIWGGVAGCFPPLIGWTAVQGSIGWPPIVLFLIVFFWTPPHTWALGLRYREDYAAVDVPMLPTVREAPFVARQILLYSVLTVATSLTLWPVAGTGWLYPLIAGLAGAWFVVEAARLLRRANAGLRDAQLQPMRLFHFSNSYLALVFIAAAIDPLLF